MILNSDRLKKRKFCQVLGYILGLWWFSEGEESQLVIPDLLKSNLALQSNLMFLNTKYLRIAKY